MDLALGISDPQGNYSASEHDLGPSVLASRSFSAVFELAEQIALCESAEEMLAKVYAANIPFLKVSVGSEIAMLMRPKLFWVANTRTVWTHLLIKHGFDYALANEELRLYRDGDQNSKMAYEKWRAIYFTMSDTLDDLRKMADAESKRQKVTPGKYVNLWLDSVANAVYEERAG